MDAPHNPPEDLAGREIVSTRDFSAPRAAVFGAFADPAALARWWGPAGFTNEFREFDFRPGGAWRFTMRGPDGTPYEMDKRFTEIAVPERIAVEHFQQGHEFTLTMTYADADADAGASTRLTWRMVFASAAECARIRDFVAAANEQNFDRLAAHLAV